MKQCAILNYKHVIYELPHEMLKKLRIRILDNEEIWEAEKQKLNCSRSTLLHINIRIRLRYSVNDCL